MLRKLVPSIMGWLVVVITLALAPTIETYNGHVTTNVTAATNKAYMLGMTALDDFGGFLMIMSLLVAGGLFAVSGMRNKNYNVGDMMQVIGAVIISVIALAMFSGFVMMAFLPPRSKNQMTACILGALLPLAKWMPSARYALASASVISSSHVSSGLPKLSATFSTAVEMINSSAPRALPNSEEA